MAWGLFTLLGGKAYKLWRNHIKGKINVPEKLLLSNVRQNVKRPLPQLQPYEPQKNARMMLLCGGPSMYDQSEEIIGRRKRGWLLATVNGAHEWCLDNGIKPSIHIQLDARRWNKRFVRRPVKECRYLISSQSHPDVFDALQDHDVTIWHGGKGIRKPILDKYYKERYIANLGGSTVGGHAITILYTLGFRLIAVYGMDSCLKNGSHHAYFQPENDKDLVFKLAVGRKRFYAHAWMVQQVDDLLGLLPLLPEDLKLDFRGDNLVSHIIQTTAERGSPPNISISERIS